MALDKAIEHKKEHRKPYYKLCEQIDHTCRNHGGCKWCEGNRKYAYAKKIQNMVYKLKEWESEQI